MSGKLPRSKTGTIVCALVQGLQGTSESHVTFEYRSNQFYQGIQITLPYTLSVFVVRHFSKGDERTVGQLTGVLAGSLFAVGCVCCFPLMPSWVPACQHA